MIEDELLEILIELHQGNIPVEQAEEEIKELLEEHG